MYIYYYQAGYNISHNQSNDNAFDWIFIFKRLRQLLLRTENTNGYLKQNKRTYFNPRYSSLEINRATKEYFEAPWNESVEKK